MQFASIGFVSRNLAILYRDKAVKDAGLDPEMQQTVAMQRVLQAQANQEQGTWG
jgi:hypothetical protein